MHVLALSSWCYVIWRKEKSYERLIGCMKTAALIYKHFSFIKLYNKTLPFRLPLGDAVNATSVKLAFSPNQVQYISDSHKLITNWKQGVEKRTNYIRNISLNIEQHPG